MARPSRRKTSEAPAAVDDDINNNEQEEEQERVLPVAVRERNRAVAEREASRLARPERRRVGNLGHAAMSKSAVTSTPFGYHNNAPTRDDNDEKKDDVQEWCGPFSVARQVSV
jgi:hypothetical protein